MMIVFNTLKIEGFAGQIDFIPFKLNQPGLNIITGPNGANKSTIFNALSWVLYGSTLKEKATVETWLHKQPDDYAGTMVQVSFEKGSTRYKIIRCRKYKKQVRDLMGRDRLVFEENGKPYEVNGTVLKDKRDIQKAITQILGMSYKLFINTVIFPQRITRFIEESGAEKKKILEESFSLTWINTAKANAQVRLDKAEQAVSSQDLVVQSIDDALAEKDEMLEEIQKSKDKFENDKSTTLAEIDSQITELEQLDTFDHKQYQRLSDREAKDQERLELLKKDKLITEKEETTEKIQELLRKKSEALTKVDFAKKHIASAKDGKCGECGQTLVGQSAKEHRRKYIKQKNEWQPKYDAACLELRPLEEDLLGAKPIEKEILQLEHDLKITRKTLRDEEPKRLKAENAKGRLRELNKKRKEKEKEQFNDISGPIKRAIFEGEKKLKKQEKELRRLQRTRNMIQWLIKVPLSNTGLKAFLFDKLLRTLNQQIQYYERFTNMGVELEVDMEGARKDINTIVTKDAYPVAYADLSGGETQSVNVTVALASGDVLTKENPTNLQVMDEVFEGLDDKNIDIVGTLLADRAKDKSLFVITHNSTFNPRNANLIRIGDEEG